MKKLLLIVLMLFAGQVLAQYHVHLWTKQNETYGQDRWGNKVIVCSWKCTADYQNQHFTQTQGSSWCPRPNP